MVRHSSANQPSSRPSWSVAPASTTPPDLDDVPASTGSLHGAIGEHRRSSRSSSVSSGGSSNNSGEGVDSALCHAHSRAPSQHPGKEVVTDKLIGCGQIDLKKDTADIFTSRNGNLQQMVPEFELNVVEFSEQPRVQMTSSDSSPFAYFMGAQPSLDAQKPCRAVTGAKTAGSFSSPVTSVDLQRLLNEPVFSPNHFVASVNQDVQQLGTSAYFDYANHPINVPATVTADTRLLDSGLQPSKPSFDRSVLGGGKFQPGFLNPGGNQFSQNSFGNLGAGGRGNQSSDVFYPQGVAQLPAFGSAAGYGSSNRQNTEHHAASSGSLQAFSSQDFSMPPPAQPWNGGAQTTLESLQAKFTCRLCNSRYKWPHALECLHVYCFPCITSKYDPVEKCISCPQCKIKTVLKDGPCSLKLDYEGVKFMRENNITPFSCTLCTRDMEAVTCCTTCSAYLCTECRDGHKNMNHFQNHTLAPVTKIRRTNNGDYTSFCDKHPSEPMIKYCCVCECLICTMCICDHSHPDFPNNTNRICPMEEVYSIVVERLNSWNEDGVIKCKDLKELTKPPLNTHVIEGKRRSCRKQIDDYTEYCKTVLDQNRMAAYDLLDRTLAEMEKDSQMWTETANKVKQELEAVTEFNIRTVQNGSISDCMSLLELMENAYKKAIENYSNIIKNNESIKIDLEYHPNYTESHTVLNQNFLSISYTINGVERKVSPTVCSQKNDVPKGPRSFPDYTLVNAENSDCNYQRWSAAPDAMPISTWNNVNDRDRKNGTFIPHLNKCRTRTSYIHMFGEFGREDYKFTEPSGQAYLKDGSYVICDTNNHRIVYYSANHEYIRTIGQPPNLPPMVEESEQRTNGPRGKGFARQDGYLYFPNRVAICPITQNIVATERPPSHDVQIFTITGEFVRCFGGSILQHPRGVTVDEDGVIIVVECKVMKLVLFSQDGSFLVSHSLTKDLEFPNDVAAKDRKIFISDNRGHCVQVFNYNAEFLYKIGNESITYFPIGVSINHLNQVVVTDNHNTFNITVFDMAGTVLDIYESVSKLAQCHNVAVHPSRLELMLTTKDCSVYFFNYDPDAAHSQSPPVQRGHAHGGCSRRPKIGSTAGSFY